MLFWWWKNELVIFAYEERLAPTTADIGDDIRNVVDPQDTLVTIALH